MAKLCQGIESIWRLKKLNQSKKKSVHSRRVFKLSYLIDRLDPPIRINLKPCKVGWEFGSSKFISDTETITYFKKGHGALLLTTRQLIKGVEQWKNLKLIKFSERPLSSLGIDLSYIALERTKWYESVSLSSATSSNQNQNYFQMIKNI